MLKTTLKYTFTLVATLGVSFELSSPVHAETIPAFDMKRCVNMGNSLDAPKGESWGAPIDPASFTGIKAKGFDTVRIPVRWNDYAGPAPHYRIEADFMAEVSRIVNAALAQELNVILNIHHYDALMENPDAEQAKLLALWNQIAARFAHEPDSLWFEVLNEPRDALKGETMRRAQTTSVATIRRTNPERVIILGGENWSGLGSLRSNITPPDKNIVYTFHYYDPFDFTHQKAKWLGKNMPKGTRKWGSRKDREKLASDMQYAADFVAQVGHPVFLGEFGAYDEIKASQRVKYIGGVRIAAEAAGIPWCLWSYSNTFELYNTDNQTWDTEALDALGLGTPPQPILKTDVVSAESAARVQESWGDFLTYYAGQSDHIKDVLSGVAIINPGEEIHPPHAHEEEEFLMVLEGSGTWSVEGQDFPAKAGDILFAAPWDLHGIKNTGRTPLKFVVFKYNKK